MFAVAWISAIFRTSIVMANGSVIDFVNSGTDLGGGLGAGGAPH